ncbi:MAG TPA: hypothetical protein VFJ58_24430, partial [Armatimonadota bacterium]|nr:hypothetical protein [Armatimonadota bacterium]
MRRESTAIREHRVAFAVLRLGAIFSLLLAETCVAFATPFPPESQTLFAWGNAFYGQLGNGTNTNSSVPVKVSTLSGVTAIAAGEFHNIALTTDGTVWTWGDNEFGQLGLGSTRNSSLPLPVNSLSGVTAVAGGDGHSLALKTDGTVWAWGYNQSGGLGNGTTTDSHVPVEVTGLSGAGAISGGGAYSLALKGDGTVWAWGYNESGDLGDGTTTDSHVPVEVTGLSGVTAISAGEIHSLALKTDGTVWAWGDNSSGQLGNGTTTNSSLPVQVSGLSSVSAIAASNGASAALKADGTVWTWGNNLHGQLGDGSNNPSTKPVKVSGLSGVTSISAGQSHFLALKADGTLWGWGGNSAGQLGNGLTDDSSLPVEVNGFTRVLLMVAGGFHSLAVAGDMTPPITTAAPSGPAGANGWYSGAVTVTLTAADPDEPSDQLITFYAIDGGAQQTYVGPVPVSGDAKHTVSYYSKDRVGNQEAANTLTIPIDSTAPVTTLTFTGPAGSDSSSFTGPVQVKLSAADNVSGVSVTNYSIDGGSQQTYGQPFTVADNGTHTLTFQSVDVAGNEEAVKTQKLLVDTSFPTIIITSPESKTYLLNQVVIASYSAADTTDGVTASAGPVPSGSAIDTASVGMKTFTVKATDTAGNSSKSSVNYTVAYGVKLLYDPTKAVSPGQPLPISLQLVDSTGNNVSSAGVALQAVSLTPSGAPQSSGSGAGPAFTYDPAGGGTGGYVLNLDTSAIPVGGFNLNFLSGNDPTLHQAAFTISAPTANIPAGVSMVSEPFASSGDLAALFGLQIFPDGSADAAIYDPVSSQYLLYPHLMGADGKSGLPGRGYWVLESKPTNVQSGAAPNPTPL